MQYLVSAGIIAAYRREQERKNALEKKVETPTEKQPQGTNKRKRAKPKGSRETN